MNHLARCGVVLAASAVLLSGCYTYVPAEPDAVPDGRDVRVYLTRPALAELPEDIVADRPFVTGSLERREEDTFIVRVPVPGRQEGFYSANIRQEIRVSAGDILEVQRREVDGARTGLLMAAAAGTATALLLQIMDASASPPDDPGDPPTELIRVPVFSIPSP